MAATSTAHDLTATGWTRAELRRGRFAFAIAAVAAFALIIYLGLGMTFFADEWAFIESRAMTDPGTWWAPHNEHWSTLAIIAYRALVETVGIGSYVPYLATVAMLHIVVGALVFALLERSSGPIVALAGSSIVLVFGSGFENLLWGFQVGFVGSLALGLGAMALMDRGPSPGRAVIVAGILLASLASSGVGLLMCVAVGTEWLLDPRWRRHLPALVVPAGAYLAWYLAAGRYGVATFRDPTSIEAILDMPPSILAGLANAFGAIAGLPILGFVVFAVLASWGAKRVAGGDAKPRSIAILVAIAVEYALIGAARGHLFDGVIDYTRYTYVAGILAMVALGVLLGPVRLPSAGRARLMTIAAIGCWMAMALVTNIGLLLDGRTIFLARADLTRALVTAALELPQEGGSGDRSLVLVPSPDELRRIVREYGDPRHDTVAGWAVRRTPPDVLLEARRRVQDGVVTPH
jgi:hypothetical protein